MRPRRVDDVDAAVRESRGGFATISFHTGTGRGRRRRWIVCACYWLLGPPRRLRISRKERRCTSPPDEASKPKLSSCSSRRARLVTPRMPKVLQQQRSRRKRGILRAPGTFICCLRRRPRDGPGLDLGKTRTSRLLLWKGWLRSNLCLLRLS